MNLRVVIEKKVSDKGVTFALVSDTLTWEVWKLCENYNRECKNGIKKTWRYVQKGMTETQARALFKKRIG